jgi:hypothetical protein
VWCFGDRSRRATRRPLAVALLFVFGLVAATAGCQVPTGAYRRSPAPIVPSSGYDYAPSVMEDGVYKMWWCGQEGGGVVPGDDIFYAESTSLDGPFHARGQTAPGFQRVFDGTGTPGTFDGDHACDPSVLRVNGTYFMYYGGLGTEDIYTDIGLASSPDGLNWTRLNGGRPIIRPTLEKEREADAALRECRAQSPTPEQCERPVVNGYGAGQPSAVYLDGRFYLMFTDTTGRAVNPGNGAGQFVYRSADPLFQDGVEVLTAAGFASLTAENARGYVLTDAVSADLQYVDALDAFAVAKNNGGGATDVEFYNAAFTGPAADPLRIPNEFAEGPGIVSRPDKHAVAPRNSDCGTVPFDLVNASGYDPLPDGGFSPPQRLVHTGVDLLPGVACADMPESRRERLFEGYAIESPDLPLALVVGGERLQVDGTTAAVVHHLTNNYVWVSPELYHSITPANSLPAGSLVIGAPGRPAAFVLDGGRVWPVNRGELITSAGSSTTYVSVAEFDAHPRGQDLVYVED